MKPKAHARETEVSEDGYLNCGPNGAGHFVKMVHNGIEYGLMAAYAEGFNFLKRTNIAKTRREAALYARFSSRGESEFQNKLLSAMRFEFGGHREKPAQ